MNIYRNRLLVGEAKKINTEIEYVAYADLTSSWQRKPHTIHRNMFYLITEGEADLWCDEKHYHMTEGNIYFIPKGTLRAYKCSHSLQKLYFYVHLHNSRGEELPIAPTSVVLQDRAETIKKMMELYRKADYHSAASLRFYIEQIVFDVFRQFPNEKAIRSHSPLINHVLRIISETPHMSLSAAVLAKQTLSSVALLRQLFKNEIGIPLGKFVQQQVLAAAAYDLLSTERTLSEISTKYGFCDQFYFRRLFTAHFGISPSKYRKDHML